MAYRLRRNLSFCISANRTVFLDLDTNRYFGLPQNWDRDFRRFIAEPGGLEDRFPVIEALLERGLLVSDSAADGCLTSPSIAPPTAILENFGNKASVGSCVRAITAQLSSAGRLRIGSLSAVVERIRARKMIAPPWDGKLPAVERIAASFERTSLLLSPADRCLPRSVAFHALCMREDCYPDLVIGVRVNPFTAHCWVQHDAYVLNDMVERVRLFTPILVI